MTKPRKNPDTDTILLALAAAAAVGGFAYWMSKKKEAENAISDEEESQFNEVLAQQGIKKPQVSLDLSVVEEIIDVAMVAIPTAIVAATGGTGAPIAAIVAFVLKEIDQFEDHAVKLIKSQWKASHAEKLIPPQNIEKFQKYLNDHASELAWRSAISYVGWLDKHGSSLDQAVVYYICRANEYVAVLTFPPVAAVRIALSKMESAYGLNNFANAGDGMRFVAAKMFYDAAIVSGVPEALADCMAARMAVAASSGEYANIYTKKAADKLRIVMKPGVTLDTIQAAAISKYYK